MTEFDFLEALTDRQAFADFNKAACAKTRVKKASALDSAALAVAKNPVVVGAAIGAATAVAVQYQANKPGKDGGPSRQQKAWAKDKDLKPVAAKMAKKPLLSALPAAIPGGLAGAAIGKSFQSFK